MKRLRHTHVVMMSSGAGSWAAAKRVAEVYGTRDMVLLFCDVKGRNPSPHAGEDEDNYRFLNEAADNVGARLEIVNEGRDIWQVYFDEHMLGNARVAPCSKQLKQKVARRWVEKNCRLKRSTLYIGIDWTEEHRLGPNQQGWEPWKVEAPLSTSFSAEHGLPLLDKAQILAWLESEGISAPRLYQYGFSHANCGGFCCRMGQAQAARLLEVFPERYGYHERREQMFREIFHTDATFLVDRRGLQPGEPRRPLTLRDFRLRVQGTDGDYDHDDWGACGCFTPDLEMTP